MQTIYRFIILDESLWIIYTWRSPSNNNLRENDGINDTHS